MYIAAGFRGEAWKPCPHYRKTCLLFKPTVLNLRSDLDTSWLEVERIVSKWNLSRHGFWRYSPLSSCYCSFDITVVRQEKGFPFTMISGCHTAVHVQSLSGFGRKLSLRRVLGFYLSWTHVMIASHLFNESRVLAVQQHKASNLSCLFSGPLKSSDTSTLQACMKPSAGIFLYQTSGCRDLQSIQI